MMGVDVWVWCALALWFGCVVQTAIGFGMAVIAAPLVVWLRPEWVPYILTSAAFTLSLANAHHLRRHVSWKLLFPACTWRLPGTAMGIMALHGFDPALLQLAVAFCVLVAVAVSLSRLRFQCTPTRMGVAGFVSGMMGTTTSIGGPPMALVMQFETPLRVRANLSAYFIFSCALSLASYGVSGLLTRELLAISIAVAPLALSGFWLGKRLQGWVDRRNYRHVVLALCAFSAAITLAGLWYR